MADDKEVDPTDESDASAAHTGSGDDVQPRRARRAKPEPGEDELSGDDLPDEVSGDEATDPAPGESDLDDSGPEAASGSRGDDPDESSSEDPEGDLVSVGSATPRRSRDRSSSGGAESEQDESNQNRAKKERSKKDKATPKQKQPETSERTTPVKFVGQSVGELRKVVYPTGEQLIRYFLVVLVFVLFIIGFVSLLDLGFGWAIFKVFA